MREIEGIERVIEKLKPHWDSIEADFNRENEHFKQLLGHDHNTLGRILKCHLIIEHYLDRYLKDKIQIEHFKSARLSFFQKATLLPNSATSASFVKPGILKLNKIRNSFGHNLNFNLDIAGLESINEILRVARPNDSFATAIECVEAFTTIACTWLIVPPLHIEKIFRDAFAEIHIHIEPETETRD